MQLGLPKRSFNRRLLRGFDCSVRVDGDRFPTKFREQTFRQTKLALV